MEVIGLFRLQTQKCGTLPSGGLMSQNHKANTMRFQVLILKEAK